MSSFALKVKKWYERGIWTEQMVRDAYEKGRITEAELQEILGSVETLTYEELQALEEGE